VSTKIPLLSHFTSKCEGPVALQTACPNIVSSCPSAQVVGIVVAQYTMHTAIAVGKSKFLKKTVLQSFLS
jgi:hypothetical protein